MAKEAFLLSQREYRQTLESRTASLEAELARLKLEIAETVRTLESRGVVAGRLGRSPAGPATQPALGLGPREARRPPLHRGLSGSTPGGRSRASPRGQGLGSTRNGSGATRSRRAMSSTSILRTARRRSSPISAVRTRSLRPPTTASSSRRRCSSIDDMAAVLAECARILRPGGVLLATVPSVIRVDDEGGLDGDFWRLTEASARKLFAEAFPIDAFEVTAYGNVMACAAFLYGLSAEEMAPADLDHVDPAFPLVIAIRAVKPRCNRIDARSVSADRPALAGSASHPAAILAYHRIADAHAGFSRALHAARRVPRAHGLPPSGSARRSAWRISFARPQPAAYRNGAVAVTLDDGYLDALTVASPILSELGVPATFFVNTDRLTRSTSAGGTSSSASSCPTRRCRPLLELNDRRTGPADADDDGRERADALEMPESDGVAARRERARTAGSRRPGLERRRPLPASDPSGPDGRRDPRACESARAHHRRPHDSSPRAHHPARGHEADGDLREQGRARTPAPAAGASVRLSRTASSMPRRVTIGERGGFSRRGHRPGRARLGRDQSPAAAAVRDDAADHGSFPLRMRAMSNPARHLERASADHRQPDSCGYRRDDPGGDRRQPLHGGRRALGAGPDRRRHRADLQRPRGGRRVRDERCAADALSVSAGADQRREHRPAGRPDCSPAFAARRRASSSSTGRRIAASSSTVNEGLAMSAAGDVVILNSDTVVSRRWLQKMMAVARARPDVATVTPLTNNGTICSVPNVLEDNAIPEGYDVESFADAGRGDVVRDLSRSADRRRVLHADHAPGLDMRSAGSTPRRSDADMARRTTSASARSTPAS